MGLHHPLLLGGSGGREHPYWVPDVALGAFFGRLSCSQAAHSNTEQPFVEPPTSCVTNSHRSPARQAAAWRWLVRASGRARRSGGSPGPGLRLGRPPPGQLPLSGSPRGHRGGPESQEPPARSLGTRGEPPAKGEVKGWESQPVHTPSPDGEELERRENGTAGSGGHGAHARSLHQTVLFA